MDAPLCPNCGVETEYQCSIGDRLHIYWCDFCEYEKVVVIEETEDGV